MFEMFNKNSGKTNTDKKDLIAGDKYQPPEEQNGLTLVTSGDSNEAHPHLNTLADQFHPSGELTKELLYCFYEILQQLDDPDCTVEEILQRIAEVLPSALQYPGKVCVRIMYDGRSVSSKNWEETKLKYIAGIKSKGFVFGRIEVCAKSDKPVTKENTFPEEQRSFIDAVGLLLGNFVSRKKTNESLFLNMEILKEEVKILRQYKQLIEASSDMIYRTDENGQIIFINPAAARFTGYKENEIVGKSYLNFIHPSYRDSVARHYTWQLMKSVPDTYKELPLISKDGSVRWIGQNVQLVIENEQVTGFQAVARDITRRRLIENELEENERRFRNLYENSTLGIYRSTPGGRIVMANPSALSILGYPSLEDLLNIDILEGYCDAKDRDNFQDIIEREGIIHGYESKWRRKDGSVVDIRESARVVRGNDNSVLYYEGVIEDITEKKKAEEALTEAKEKAEEINRLKSNLLANMSHELRTPLSSILGFSEMLMGEVDSPVNNEMIRSIHQSGLRLLRTFNSLLNLSKLEAEKVELKLTEVDVAGVILRLADVHKPDAANKNLLLNTEFRAARTKAVLDEDLLNQILSNLINNAIVYSNKGEISIILDDETIDETSWLVIRIKDTGIGIPAESLGYIFEPFRQASEGLSRQYEGVGVGLTLTKRYVEMMKGIISVESEVGKGSTFTVKFPVTRVGISKPEMSDLKTKSAPEDIELSDHMPRVLLVENEEASVRITKFYLKDICVIDDVTNGKDALLMIIEKPYDAVIMDIDLGGEMDGIETAGEIRKLPKYREVPIIALTAYAMKGDREKFLSAGCSHYMSKPYKREELISLMKSILPVSA